MSSSSRTLLVTAALLVGAPCAYAANAEAPGALKKQTTIETATPAPAPAPVATTPQSSTGGGETKTQAQAPTKVSENVPVTKGTVKKLVETAPSQTESVTTEANTGDDGTSATTRRRSARRGGAGTRARRAGRTATRGSARARRGSSPVRAGGRAVDSESSSPASVAADITAAQRARRAADRKKPAAAPKRAGGDDPAEQQVKGFRSITHAADRVVEVIPGTVLLALAAMTALVFLLMIRSYRDERQRRAALEASYGVTVEALATAIEAKDHTTGGHIERVRRLGLLLADEMVPGEAKDPQMAYGFLLHDIGKLAVPDAILRAPGRLSDEEWIEMRRHPEAGVAMLSHVPFLGRALDVVRHHHERWDGGGYPDGLAGEEIPLWARIFAVVDALDAITADRPYRARASYDAALGEIRAHAGTQFDPAVVEALERLDPAVVAPLLEPAQMSDRLPLEELPDAELPAKLVAV